MVRLTDPHKPLAVQTSVNITTIRLRGTLQSWNCCVTTRSRILNCTTRVKKVMPILRNRPPLCQILTDFQNLRMQLLTSYNYLSKTTNTNYIGNQYTPELRSRCDQRCANAELLIPKLFIRYSQAQPHIYLRRKKNFSAPKMPSSGT